MSDDMSELKQESFNLGRQYYKQYSTYPKGTVQAEFLRGVYFQERISKCAFEGKIWNKTGSHKSL